MVYCMDCAHFTERGALCHHPESLIKVNPVYGIRLYRQAEEMRRDIKLCRWQGRYFEQKPTKVTLFGRLKNLFGNPGPFYDRP